MAASLRLVPTALALFAALAGSGCSKGSHSLDRFTEGLLTVEPASAAMAPGEVAQFAALVQGVAAPVVWTVLEPDGGTVDEHGTYTAPAVEGTYHVVVSVSGAALPPATAVVTVLRAARGPQLYVATNGDDANPGTLEQPWRTLQKAMDSAPAGATVNIRGGTYGERLHVNVQGTQDAPITFQPYGFSIPAGGCGGYTGAACGGEQVILDYGFLGTNWSATPLLYVNGKSHLRIQGLTFQNFTCNGAMQQMIRIDGDSGDVELKYNKIRNSQTLGAWDGSTAFMPIRVWGPSHDVWIYGNELSNLVTSYGEALTADNGAVRVTIENNYLHHLDAIGIDVQRGSHDYVIRGNRLEWISKKQDGSWWYGSPAAAIYNDGGYGGVMERNHVSNAGVGLQALTETSYPAHDIVIRNNVATGCLHGVVVGTWYSSSDGSSVWNVSVVNNTFHGNTNGAVIRPMTSSTVHWRSNLFAANGSSWVNTLGWDPGDAAYNLYSGGGSGPGAVSTADPQLVDPWNGDFRVAASSPALDAGDPGATTDAEGAVDHVGHPRISNGRIDIGAYEVR